eukprot:gene48955-65285_t
MTPPPTDPTAPLVGLLTSAVTTAAAQLIPDWLGSLAAGHSGEPGA